MPKPALSDSMVLISSRYCAERSKSPRNCLDCASSTLLTARMWPLPLIRSTYSASFASPLREWIESGNRYTPSRRTAQPSVSSVRRTFMRPAASSIGSWVTNASQRVAGGDASGSETGAFERAIASHHVALAGGGVYQGGLRGARTRRARTTGGAPGPRPACATETRPLRHQQPRRDRGLLRRCRRKDPCVFARQWSFHPHRCPGRNQHGRRRYQRERPSRRLLRRPAIAGEATATALIRVGLRAMNERSKSSQGVRVARCSATAIATGCAIA